MVKYGYARVSDKSQQIQSQIDELNAYGIDDANIVQEVITGVAATKDGLDRLVEKLQPGDELVVARHDRLGRSTLQLLTLIDELEKKDVHFKMLSMPELDIRGPFGKPILAIFSAFAEMERNQLKEKQKIGIEAARRRGKHLGKKSDKWNRAGLESALQEYIKGEKSVNEISEIYNVPRSTIYHYVKKAGIKRLEGIRNDDLSSLSDSRN